MTGPSTPPGPTPTAHVLGVVDEWEFGCCAPLPVVGGTTWWRWTFAPHLGPSTTFPDQYAVFTHRWSIRSMRKPADGSTALELRSGDFVAWWHANEHGEFVWHDAALGPRTVAAASVADVLVGQTVSLRGRLWGGRHGGGPDDALPLVGARVLGLTVLGRRSWIETDRTHTLLERTARREPKGPPRFWAYPESDDPPIEFREHAVVMELAGLAPREAARDRKGQGHGRTLPIDDLRGLLAAVPPLAPGTMLVAARHGADRSRQLPPGFQPPRHPHEWTTQDTDLLGAGAVTTLHRRTVIRRLGPTDDHPEGAEREEFPDGVPLWIRNGRQQWRFHHWPTDTFRVPGDRELTAVESTARDDPGPPYPPRPTGWRDLVDGEDPVGEIRATTALGRPCWTYTRPGPPRSPWAITRVIVDAETGWLVAESRHGGWSQVRWSDVRVVPSPGGPDLRGFTWAGPSRPIEWFRRDWRATRPVRPA